MSDRKGTTLFRAFLLCLIGVAFVFVALVSVVWVYSSSMLYREQEMVSNLLPELDAAYQLTAATAGLQSQGFLLSNAVNSTQLSQRREQIELTLSTLKDASDSLELIIPEQRLQLNKEISLIALVTSDISDSQSIQLNLKSTIDAEKRSLLEYLLQIEKTVQANVVAASNELLAISDTMAQFDPVMSNSAKELSDFTGQVASYDEGNLKVQDFLLLNQDFVSLAAVIERVPLLTTLTSIEQAEQTVDLLLSALVARTIYISDKNLSDELLSVTRTLRERLRSNTSLFVMQSDMLLSGENQLEHIAFMRGHMASILQISDSLRVESRDDVNGLAELTLASVRESRWVLIGLGLLALLTLAAIAYWLLYRKTIVPLLEITQRITDVGSSRFPNKQPRYFLNELATLSNAVFQLDDAHRAQHIQEMQLRHVNKNLEQANEELRQFAHVASHDLQEPLRKLRQFSDLLEEDYASVVDDEGRYFLKTIRNSARRMSELIKATLDYSRSGSANQLVETVHLDEVLMNVWLELDLAVSESQAELQADPLPSISANAVGVAQLFRNLFSNALRYRKPDTKPVITVSFSEVFGAKNESLSIRIADNGVGIAEEHLQRIFIPFERLHNDELAGSGLGLAICKKVCDAHGWTLLVNSDVNQGTVFDIHLPASALVV